MIENLAGDLLPKATLEQKIASGFNRCNITTSEGGAIEEEYLVLYARDRTDTSAQVWLGLTAGCAVCHDYKCEPLSQKEFYQLSAFFSDTTQKAMDGNAETHRQFLRRGANFLGTATLAALAPNLLFADDKKSSAAYAAMKALGPHFPPKARRVIYLHMVGGPPQMDLFDYKPVMNE